MESASKSNRTSARLQAELAAQWLNLLGFSAFPGAVTFSPSMSHYHSMLDPGESDETCLQSCRQMLACVQRRLHVEDLEGLAKYRRERPVDPYGKAWRTTRSGAELYMIAHLLKISIRGFEEGC